MGVLAPAGRVARRHAHMKDELRQFIIDSLRSMNYDVSGIDDSTELGPAGLDLESLALAELAVRLEDRYGLKFSDDDMESLGLMSLGEFADAMAVRLAASDTVASGAAASGTAAAGAGQGSVDSTA